MFENPIGKKNWIIPGGNVPVTSHGHEPEFTSHDKISILNTGSREATILLTIYFSGQEPYGPYELKAQAKRVKKVRFNDLIDPLPLPLGEPFACSLVSDEPVVVQFSRQDTSQRENAGCTTLAFPVGSA